MAKSTSDEEKKTRPLLNALTSLFAVLVGALVGVGAGVRGAIRNTRLN